MDLEADRAQRLSLEGGLQTPTALEALDYRHQEVARVMDSLCQKKLCRPLRSRQGQPLYLFDDFLPAVRLCPYCDQERPHQPQASTCPCCGAP